MTRTARQTMLQDVIADRVKQTAYRAWWNYHQKPTETGTVIKALKKYNYA